MKLNNLNAGDIKEQISLIDLLAQLGYQPLRKSGREHIYLSMLRDSDTRPSFTVNENLNVWYDHGTGKGGNLIDFGMAYWHLSFIETLKKISDLTGHKSTCIQPDRSAKRRHARKLPHYQVEEIKPLGNNDVITAYLQGRGIWQSAQGMLQEVYYYVEDEKKLRKYFFAAGWQNELGYWEVRNLYFKGCLGHKAITWFHGCDDRLAVFEGYFNYLSWITENPFAPESVIVLNSATLLESAKRKAKDFEHVSLFFDRDDTGRQASDDFIKALPQAVDCSAYYTGHNDYNDMLTSRSKRSFISR